MLRSRLVTHSQQAQPNAKCLLGHAHLMLLVNVDHSVGTSGYLQHSFRTYANSANISVFAGNTDFLFHDHTPPPED